MNKDEKDYLERAVPKAPLKPIEPSKFLDMVPSSRATPPPKLGSVHQYNISVQRLDPKSNRWKELATWDVTTVETDMYGPLSCGLKPNYRIILSEGKVSPDVDKEPTDVG